MTFSGIFDAGEVISFVRDELKKLGLFLKNRKTAVISGNKRQTVTGIVVNEKLNIAREYKKKIRQEMYYIKRFGLEAHMVRAGILDRQLYVNSLLGRISYVLQTTPDDTEFQTYKETLAVVKKQSEV